MKRLFFLILLLPLAALGQTSLSAQQFNLATDMTAKIGTEGVVYRVNNLITADDGNGGDYVWNALSTAVADGFGVLAVTGVPTGRYLKKSNSNTVKFTTTITGLALQTSYYVTFPTPLAMIPAMIIPALYSNVLALSIAIDDATVTKTGFKMNITGLTVGQNVTIKYLVIKY